MSCLPPRGTGSPSCTFHVTHETHPPANQRPLMPLNGRDRDRLADAGKSLCVSVRQAWALRLFCFPMPQKICGKIVDMLFTCRHVTCNTWDSPRNLAPSLRDPAVRLATAAPSQSQVAHRIDASFHLAVLCAAADLCARKNLCTEISMNGEL